MFLGLFPQSSLDHFHIHREPSRLVNPSAIQNNTSCRPSPCGWLSQPRTTTTAPPLVCLIGEKPEPTMSAWLRDHPTRTSFPGSLIDTQASTFRFRRWHTQQRSAALSEHHSITGMSRDFHEHRSFRLIGTSESFQPFQTIPYSGRQLRTTSVLAGMRGVFPKGVRRFLLVTMRGLYLAGLPRL